MQVALGLEPKQGRHVVFLEYDGQKSVIGAVTPGVIEQFQIDFPVIMRHQLPACIMYLHRMPDRQSMPCVFEAALA
jgi:hypothetical protein